MKEWGEINGNTVQCKLKGYITLDTMPSSLSVNEIGQKWAISKIKQGKVSLKEEIRNICSFSLDRRGVTESVGKTY